MEITREIIKKLKEAVKQGSGREGHLAYGIARGTAYSRMEQTSNCRPQAPRVAQALFLAGYRNPEGITWGMIWSHDRTDEARAKSRKARDIIQEIQKEIEPLLEPWNPKKPRQKRQPSEAAHASE